VMAVAPCPTDGSNTDRKFTTIVITAASDDSPPVGVYPTDVQLLEMIQFINFQFHFRSIPSPSLLVSGSNGVAFLSLVEPYFETINGEFLGTSGSLWGAIAISGAGLGGARDQSLSLFMFGPNGSAMSSWVPEEDSFGITQISHNGQNITDAHPYDGDSESGGFCYVIHSGGSIFTQIYNPDTGFFESDGNFFSFPNAPANVVSAYVRSEGSMLAVTDGSPGAIYRHDRVPNTDAIGVGGAGLSPRRLRVSGEVVVISNHDSDDLTIATWDDEDVVTMIGTIAVGDGPVGFDLLGLENGNVAIASTGFNDNSFSVTVVDPAGVLVSNDKYDMPEGCEGPGHAAWLPGGMKIIVSCNTTNNLAVVASGL
jgi:hypothetical protein